MEKTTLNNVACGQAPVLFARELRRVLGNIADDEMPARAARKIVLEFTFRPDESRVAIVTTVRAVSKLCEAGGVAGLLYAVNDDGEIRASNSNPTQLDLGDQLRAAQERKA